MATALKSKSFQRNLLLSIGGVFLLFAICFSVYQYKREKEYKIDILHSRLQMYNYEMVQTVGKDSMSCSRRFRDYVVHHQMEGLRVSVIDKEGRVIFDSYDTDVEALGNHLQRTEIQQALKELHWSSHEATIPEDLCFVYGQYLEDYLFDVEICQRFARRNREKMAEILLSRSGLTAVDAFHTIHNYIDTEEMILRKGAIAAHKGEMVLIPINMRDGSVLAVGKGNPEWNFSAPHGAGRIMSRTAARANLDMEEYRREMAGVYTTTVNEATIDEAPMAYKSLEDIIGVISESVDIIEVLKPIYNFKAN